MVIYRPLERMIGCIKRKIKSASKPAENVANVVLAHHQFSQNQWDDQPPQQCSKSPEHIPIAEMVSVYTFNTSLNIPQVITNYFQKVVTDESVVTILESYNLKESNQVLCFGRGHPSPLVIVNNTDNTLTGDSSLISRDEKSFQVCQLESMFSIMNVNLALMKVIVSISQDNDVTQSFFYNEKNTDYEWKIVELENVYCYAVIIKSLRYPSRLYINW